MAAFDDLTAGLTDAVFAEFGDAATLTPADGSGAVTVRASLDRGTREEALERGVAIVPRVLVRIPYADAPRLRARDVVEIGGKGRFQLAGAPYRTGQGITWEAEVSELVAS